MQNFIALIVAVQKKARTEKHIEQQTHIYFYYIRHNFNFVKKNLKTFEK